MDEATNATLTYFVTRLQEPSTWVSLGSVLTGLGVVISPEHWQAIMGICMVAGGGAGVFLRERAKTAAEIKTIAAQTVVQKVEPGALK